MSTETCHEEVQIVQRGEMENFEESECAMVVKGDRRFFNYKRGKFEFLVRGLGALYGVAKHSKFQAKLSLMVTDPDLIAQFDAISDRIKAEFDQNGIFKPFLLGDASNIRYLSLKITDDSSMYGGGSVMGKILPDDVCTAVFSTSVYKYGQYYGFSHRLKVVKSKPAPEVQYDL